MRWPPTATRAGAAARTPTAPPAHEPPRGTCSFVPWLHPLKLWSLREIRAGSHRAAEARLTTQQIVGLYAAGGANGLRAFDDALALEAGGRLRGLNDWIAFTADKDTTDLRRALGELTEAQRQAADHPTEIINVGGDQRAPRRASDGSAMQSFDIAAEDQAGTVSRSVEVTTVDNPVEQRSDVTNGVRHAIDKVESRANPRIPSDSVPIPGTHEATIRMSLAVGDTAIAGGRIRRIAPDGEVRIIDGMASSAFAAEIPATCSRTSEPTSQTSRTTRISTVLP